MMNLKKTPTIHQTDCYHHHADPDDHWDLACQFALAYLGDIDLQGVLLDYPLRANDAGLDCGDPAVLAVAQLNQITGQFVPCAVGYEKKISAPEELQELSLRTPLPGGISMLLHLLEKSPKPAVIHIVGSCRDVAAAAALRPDLFEKKCKAVYLNSGTGQDDGVLNYNVRLDPYAYRQMFSLPCPLYWMPCYHAQPAGKGGQSGPYGTWWSFRQKQSLPYLSTQMQNYFCYALGRVSDNRWLSYLKYPVNPDLLAGHGEMIRHMWCTAGFLHAAGKTVTAEGEILPLDTPNIHPVFDFIPIDVSCAQDGRTAWKSAPSQDRFIFKILDLEHYENAMLCAMNTLLKALP